MYSSRNTKFSHGVGFYYNDPTPGPDLNAIEVDTYQIAVPNGDCSVHLTVQRTGNLEGKILSSILMDGGNDGLRGAENAAKIIEDSLEMIRARYDPGGPKEIQFDAWVITHWDNDHWAGSLRMLQKSIDHNGQSTRFKYDGNNNPLSRLYCPNWVGLPKYPDVLVPPDADLLKKRPNDLFIKGDDQSKFGEEGGTGQVYFRNCTKDGYPLCIAKWGHRQLLGIDFFTGHTPWHYLDKPTNKLADNAGEKILEEPVDNARQKLLDKSAYNAQQNVLDKSADNARQKVLGTIDDVKNVAELTNFQDTKYPRFVCIGVGGFVCGARVNKPALEVALATRRKTQADTWANLSSIMSVLFFPEATHLSLYWGGDTITPIEIPLAQSSFFNGYRCSVAKWSHHGGRHSNPKELWEKLKPKNCVVSPNRTGQYLHPSPDTIGRFQEYAKTQREKPKIYSTFYPGWILRRAGQEQRQKDWHEVSPLLPESLACPTYVYDPRTRSHHLFKDGYTLPEVQKGSSTKRSTWQIQFIHILSSATETRDGIIRPFATAHKSAEATPTTIGLVTDAYDAILDDQLEESQWANENEESGLFQWTGEQLRQRYESEELQRQQQQQGQQMPAYPPWYHGQSQSNNNQQGNSSQYSNQSYTQQPGNYQQNYYGQNFNQGSNQNHSQNYNQQSAYTNQPSYNQPSYNQTFNQNSNQNYNNQSGYNYQQNYGPNLSQNYNQNNKQPPK